MASRVGCRHPTNVCDVCCFAPVQVVPRLTIETGIVCLIVEMAEAGSRGSPRSVSSNHLHGITDICGYPRGITTCDREKLLSPLPQKKPSTEELLRSSPRRTMRTSRGVSQESLKWISPMIGRRWLKINCGFNGCLSELSTTFAWLDSRRWPRHDFLVILRRL